jgi:phosphoribosyl 1,2-cyclic phosphodiesterase
MRIWVLGSGSRGNAVLLEAGDSRVLIDAGFPVRVMAERLAAIGVPPESIEAVVITHEHTDHLRGACAAARKWGWALHATEGTVRAYPELAETDVCTFEGGAILSIGGFDVRTVAVSHDAMEPVAVVATARHSGARMAVAYDLGWASTPLRTALADLDVLVLEANHDDGMLRAGPYPPSVQQRIASRAGHLSNRAAAAIARSCEHPALGQIVLAHLSDCCNTAPLARDAILSGLAGTRFRGAVDVAGQDTVGGPYTPRLRARRQVFQLALDL